jgi:hypothetical protein
MKDDEKLNNAEWFFGITEKDKEKGREYVRDKIIMRYSPFFWLPMTTLFGTIMAADAFSDTVAAGGNEYVAAAKYVTYGTLFAAMPLVTYFVPETVEGTDKLITKYRAWKDRKNKKSEKTLENHC